MRQRPRRGGWGGVLAWLVAVPALAASAVSTTSVPSETSAPLLEEQARASALVVLARVEASEPYAGGRLRVHRLGELDVLRGSAPSGLALLDESVAGQLTTAGETVWLFLEPAPGHSFHREHLPASGRYFVPVGGSAGVVAVDEAQHALARELSRGTQGGFDLARRELRSGHTRLVLDAGRRVQRRLAAGDALGRDDLAALHDALEDERVEVPARSELVALLADPAIAGARGLLEAWYPEEPRLRGDRAEALAAHGAAPDPPDTFALLDDADPEKRRLGIRQAAVRPTPENVRALGDVALGDPDSAVRVAAIEALGRTRSPEAALLLRRTFEVEEYELRTASARALRAMGRGHAEAAFLDLVLYGDSYDVQRYALFLLLGEVGPEDARIDQIVRDHPDDRIRELLAEGIQPDPH